MLNRSQMLTKTNGWKRAENLKAIEDIRMSATDAGIDITIIKVLADISRTFIIYEINGKAGEWEVLKAILTDNNEFKYYDEVYRLFYPKFNNILIFKPISDDINELTLRIEKIGLPRSNNAYVSGGMVLQQPEKSNVPPDVKEKLEKWGLELSDERKKLINEKHDVETIKRYFKEIINGIWAITFPVDCKSRKNYTSIEDIDIKIILFDKQIAVKRLVKGISEWILEYDIRGINSEDPNENFFQHVRESGSFEEFTARINAEIHIIPTTLDFSSFTFAVRCGKEIFDDKSDLGYFIWEGIKGTRSLVFDPPMHQNPINLIIRSAYSIKLLTPLEFIIGTTSFDNRVSFPIIISFKDLNFKGFLTILKLQFKNNKLDNHGYYEKERLFQITYQILGQANNTHKLGIGLATIETEDRKTCEIVSYGGMPGLEETLYVSDVPSNIRTLFIKVHSVDIEFNPLLEFQIH